MLNCDTYLDSDESVQSTVSVPTVPSGKRQLSLAQRLALGTRLTELREQKGLSQLEVARQALGFTVSHAAVSRLERGVFGIVDNDRLDKLAEFYATTVTNLLAEMEGRTAAEDEEEPEEYRSTEHLTVQPGVANRLFNLRQGMGLTKLQMANHLGHVNVATWQSWETGRATPRPDTLLEIAIACEISAAWLITGRRAKPQAPVFSMRLRAMQKIYDLSNRELALLAGMDIESGRSAISRATRLRRLPPRKTIDALATALDVPFDWLCPPDSGYITPERRMPQPSVVPTTTSPMSAGDKFVEELRELFASGVLEEAEIHGMRNRFMKEMIRKVRNT